MKPGMEKGSNNPSSHHHQAEKDIKNYKNNNKKQSNKGLCPFACPTCQLLGGDLVKSKYEIINILPDTGDSIFSPMHEQYHDYYKDHNRSAVRNGSGEVFLSADLVDSFFQKNSRNNK